MPRLTLRGTGDPEVDLLVGAVGVAALLGWISIGAVLLGLATGLPVRNQGIVLSTTIIGALGHAALGFLPWPRLLQTHQGRVLLGLWAAALVAGTVGLVLTAGGQSRMDLLFFLVLPWLATIREGRQRLVWLAGAGAAFLGVLAFAPDPLPPAEALLHGVLVAGATILAVLLSTTARRQSLGRAAAIRRAELEGAMLAEGHHRVKNSLQVVADLLLLGRPDGDAASGEAFDQAASRIRSIAAVHDVLARRSGGRVPADELLAAVADAADPDGTHLDVEPVSLAFQQAQHVGVVVNELVTNAHLHGRPPVTVRLHVVDEASAPGDVRHDGSADQLVRLEVCDGGLGISDEQWASPGLGLRLVRQVATQGLGGELQRSGRGVMIEFRSSGDAHPRR